MKNDLPVSQQAKIRPETKQDEPGETQTRKRQMYKVALFSLLTLAFEVLEHVIGGFLHGKDLLGALQEIMAAGRDELLAPTLVVLFACVPFSLSLRRGGCWVKAA